MTPSRVDRPTYTTMNQDSGFPEARLAAAILDRAVDGQGLASRTLREELGAKTTHVVFLRHFG